MDNDISAAVIAREIDTIGDLLDFITVMVAGVMAGAAAVVALAFVIANRSDRIVNHEIAILRDRTHGHGNSLAEIAMWREEIDTERRA